jgi:PKHD-type hydroxylase
MITIHTVPRAFTPAQCDLLVGYANQAQAADAKLVNQAADHNIRRSELVWVDDIEGADWVMGQIIDVVRTANRDVYNFDLSEFAESAQIARYGAERQGHFDWHSDIGEGHFARKRKLTIVIQLSDEQNYTGGTLEIMASNAITKGQKERGTATVFPSYLLHRVTPVETGERHSLTVWAHGPAFR